MQRERVAGWQLPYLRVALILRQLTYEMRECVDLNALRRELSNIERIRGEVRRAGWFN
jgi:hypothetical protein